MLANKSTMKTVSVAQRIAVPAQAAWEVVRSGSGMDKWVPAISSCRLEGQGPGASRVCVINEQELHETIETVDDTTRLFQYRIHRQSLLPVRNILATVQVTAMGDSEAQVLWFVNLELDDPAAWPSVKDGIESIYRSAIDGLARFVGRS